MRPVPLIARRTQPPFVLPSPPRSPRFASRYIQPSEACALGACALYTSSAPGGDFQLACGQSSAQEHAGCTRSPHCRHAQLQIRSQELEEETSADGAAGTNGGAPQQIIDLDAFAGPDASAAKPARPLPPVGCVALQSRPCWASHLCTSDRSFHEQRAARRRQSVSQLATSSSRAHTTVLPQT